jgi:hypothetical protein
MWFVVFISVFLINLMPAFSPPTWLVMSAVEVLFQPDHVLLALIGALAATAGRLVLAKLSELFLRNNLLSQKSIQNIDFIRIRLENNKGLTVGAIFFYAFSPFPSNYIFIAYGLTGLKLRYIGIPFFFGRLLSYLFWIFTASGLSRRMESDTLRSKGIFGLYFVSVQIATLLAVFLFTKIDWQTLIKEKRLRLLKKN